MAFLVATWTVDRLGRIRTGGMQEVQEVVRQPNRLGQRLKENNERVTLETEILPEALPFLMALSRTPRAMPALKYTD